MALDYHCSFSERKWYGLQLAVILLMMTLYMYVCVQLFYYCYSAYVLDSLRSHLTSSTITTVQHIERFLQTIDPAITLKACAYKVSKLLS